MFLWVSLSLGIENAMNIVGHIVVPVTTGIMNIHSTIAGELIKLTVIGGGGHPIYYRQKQKAKNEFFFIYLNEDGKHRAEHMTKANKKFVRLVSETRSDYPDMVDILNRYSDYSPEDLEADKMLELPFERFKKMADAAMKEHCWKNFSVGKQKDSHLEPVRVQWNNETNQWVISERVVKTREKYRGWSLVSLGTETVEEIEEKKFDSLEECYDYIHPFYGERYLKNGYLKERYYYGK